MTRHTARLTSTLAAALLAVTGVASAQAQATDGANNVMPWAYVLNDPLPDDAATPDPNEVVTLSLIHI